MDEAQKEDPLITAINIGHREVKEEFETCFRDVRHKLPKSVPFLNSHDLWQHITGCFQVIDYLYKYYLYKHACRLVYI